MRFRLFLVAGFCAIGIRTGAGAASVPVDLAQYDSACGITVTHQEDRLRVAWPVEGEATAQLVIDLRAGKPLLESLSITGAGTVLSAVDPALFLVVGERQAPGGRPPAMSVFNVFFDTPANRPYRSHAARLDRKRVRVVSIAHRATISIGDLTGGPFSGEWQLTLFRGTALVQLEAVVTTQEPRRAYFYDLGWMSESPTVQRLAWIDTEGSLQRLDPITNAASEDHPVMVRHRMIVAESDRGAVACFPPPHQYFFPRDLTDNQGTVWHGRNHRGLDGRFGFGIRQTERGGGAYVPWVNAPPATRQRLCVFLLPVAGSSEEAMKAALAYTHGDQFPRVPGFHTLASHFHMAIAMAALEEQGKGGPRTIPDFVAMFKAMGVDMVHLAEFHGDGHPGDPGPRRLRELQAMFEECRRLSDERLLLIPGEEANVYLGVSAPGQHPGHWLYLFPRPVYWTMKRAPGQPFSETVPPHGTVYHVGSRADMLRLLEEEDGLAWTAHARIKASSWTPDAYRLEDFFQSDRWLGAAWKAMPADLSDDRLGRRVLDLLDDMANWGARKQVLGEVDVFKLDHTHELYGHMNINYVRLDRVPSYQEGWKSVLKALRDGAFFVSTGEIVVPEFTLEPGQDGKARVRARVAGTFPLSHAELISGDGKAVSHHRLALTDVNSFEARKLDFQVDLKGRTWARLEVWDVARNGAFTQPIWLGPARGASNRP